MRNDMRDRLVEILKQKTCHYSDTPCDNECGVCGNIELYSSDIEKLADHLIANDVVPVVRCKDCGHYDNGYCTTLPTQPIVARRPNDFCSYGKRKSANG